MQQITDLNKPGWRRYLGVIVVLVIFFVLMIVRDRQEIMDYPKIKAAGYLELKPVNVTQKQITQYRRRRSNTVRLENYVKFEVKIGDETRNFYMPTGSAYGSNTPSAGLSAVKSKKIIERYIFYTDEHIYYSNRAKTTGEYILESLSGKLIGMASVVAIMGIAFLLGAKLSDAKAKNAFGKK